MGSSRAKLGAARSGIPTPPSLLPRSQAGQARGVVRLHSPALLGPGPPSSTPPPPSTQSPTLPPPAPSASGGRPDQGEPVVPEHLCSLLSGVVLILLVLFNFGFRSVLERALWVLFRFFSHFYCWEWARGSSWLNGWGL